MSSHRRSIPRSSLLAIDSHHHIWNPSVGDFSWMTAAHKPINREFTLDDLKPLLLEARISHTILVQTWSSLEETEKFLSLAGQTEFIVGVIGWVNFKENVVPQIDRLMAHPHATYLKGLRHQVHDEPDKNWLINSQVLRGLATLREYGLTYDLLIRPREIPAAVSCIERLPGQTFVIDHIAKPKISQGWDVDWEDAISRLADFRDRVWIKLSGLVTEADWKNWSYADIAPYVRRVIELFGPERVMAGSDWPVCNLASDYSGAIDLVRTCISEYNGHDQECIMRNSAVSAYSLDLS